MHKDHRLQLGEPAGDLIATSPEAGETRLLELTAGAVTVLVLLPSLTGAGCRGPLRRLAAADATIRRLGGRTIAVGPGGQPDAAELAEQLDLPFPVLAAEPGDSARELWSPPGWWRPGRDGYRFVVIDREQVVRQLQHSRWPRRSVDLDAVVACLRSLQGR